MGDTGKGAQGVKGGKRRSSSRVKRFFACLAVGALLAVPLPFVNTLVGYVPLIAYLFSLALMWVYVRLLRRGLTYEQGGIGGGCLREDSLAFEFTVHNRSILPAVSIDVLFFISDLFGGERESRWRNVSLPPRSSKTFAFSVKFDHIGTYEVGIKEVSAADPFGIFHHTVIFQALQEVAVQPRLFEVAKVGVSTDASKESSRSITTVIDDGMDYCGVREYRWGDPIKSVHWKLSSRMPYGDYLTRLYETSRNPGMAILIDCDAPDAYGSGLLMDAYDAIVEAAFSVEAWGSRHAFETELLFVDKTGRRRRFEGPLSGRIEAILERLPRIASGDSRLLIDMLHSESASIYAQDNLVVCSSNVGNELVGELMRVKASRHNPILIAVIPEGADDDRVKEAAACLARLSAASIAFVVISAARELE